MGEELVVLSILITDVADDINFNKVKILGTSNNLRLYTNKIQIELLLKH